MIKIEKLSKFYGDTQILFDVNLEVKKGEIFAIVGHSGAGKSTLLRCINGLESYQGGSLKVFDKEIKNLDETQQRNLRRDVGMIFQHFALMARKNVFENVATPLKFWGYKSDETEKRVRELLNLVGLESKAKSYPSELSGGQKQRVDEATSALDPNTTNQILELLEKINKELDISVVIVTHEMEVVKSIAKRAILLEGGKIIGSGSIEELFLKPDEKMKEFLGEVEILPSNGTNIRLFFPKEVAQNSVITHMARSLNIDFNIVWGKLEKLNDNVLGSLVINIDEKDKENVLNYIKQSGVLWEVA